MTGHLTEEILEGLRTKTIPAHDLVVVDDHLASCPSCREMIASSFRTEGAAKRLEQALVPAVDHLKYAELEAYVDGGLSGEERIAFEKHIEACEECETELRELRDFAAGSPTAVASNSAWLSSLGAFFFRPVGALASAVLLLSIGAAIWLMTGREEVAVLPDGPDVIAPTEPSTATPQLEAQPDNTVVAPVEESGADLAISINDGGHTVGIAKGGELIGYPSLRSNYRTLVAKTLSEEKLAVPNLSDLNTEAGVLMGDDSARAASFRVHSPVGKVVAADSPTFSWQAVPGAESYTVEVYDQEFNKIASSGELKNRTWKHKLPRGRTYIWQVTAVSNGKVFKAPQRPHPDARFRILDRRTSDELSALRRNNPRSHLVLGTAYANAGLIDEAVREFEMLAKQNPDSEIARKLLRQIRRLGN